MCTASLMAPSIAAPGGSSSMRNLLASLSATVVSLAASPASADRVCTGDFDKDQIANVSVDIGVDDHGRVVFRRARWGIAPDGGDEWPILGLAYEIEGRSIGRLTDVTFLHVVPLETPPKSAAAEIRVRVDGAGDWRRAWQLYARMMAEHRAGRSNAVAIGGAVPLAFVGSDATENADLIGALGPARHVEISVVGDAADEDLGSGRYTLDTAGRDARFQQALTNAEDALRNWRRCERAGG